MRIVKTRNNNYYIQRPAVDGSGDVFIGLDFLEQGASDRDISAYVASVQGHGAIWRESVMGDHFENWGDFPELVGCGVFFEDFSNSAQRMELVKPAPFPRYEQRPVTLDWVLANA